MERQFLDELKATLFYYHDKIIVKSSDHNLEKKQLFALIESLETTAERVNDCINFKYQSEIPV